MIKMPKTGIINSRVIMVSFGCCAFISPQGEIPALISASAWALLAQLRRHI